MEVVTISYSRDTTIKTSTVKEPRFEVVYSWNAPEIPFPYSSKRECRSSCDDADSDRLSRGVMRPVRSVQIGLPQPCCCWWYTSSGMLTVLLCFFVITVILPKLLAPESSP